MSKLEKYIEDNLVSLNYGDYGGINTPTIEQLLYMQILIQREISKRLIDNGIDI